MDTPASSAYIWALHEMGFSEFNDQRLTQRAVKIAATFLQHPQRSIPAGCGNWAATKATYRFFANDKIHSQNMLTAHMHETVNRCSPCPIVLVAQDTTTINQMHKKIRGLGNIGAGDIQGCFIHSALAMNTLGVPQGLLYQKIFVRKELSEKRKTHYDTLPITKKETGRWVEAVSAVGKQLPGKRVVMIGDRESDIYDVFKTGKRSGIDLLIRTNQNRTLAPVDQEKDVLYLFDKAKNGQVITVYETTVPTTADGHKKRDATLTIRIASCLLQPATFRRRKKKRKEHGLPVYLLDITEEHPPANEEPIHWRLTTTLAVTTAEEAREKVTWYMYRWRIERFHYILKTGAFTIEKLQFETFSRFKKAITMYAIVATRVLFMTYEARAHPQADARLLFSSEELRALRFKEKKENRTMTIQEAAKALAKLGGYLARDHDGPPGVKTLWLGFQALQFILYGMTIPKDI